MTDLGQRASAAGRHVASTWNEQREQAVWARLQRARRRDSRVRVMLAAAAVLAVLIGVAGWQLRGRGGETTASGAGAASAVVSPLLQLGDGSTVTALSADAQYAVVEDGSEGATIRMTGGTARFAVTPQAGREFIVLAGPATVRVIGTAFQVTLGPEHVLVAVESGRVRLTWPRGSTELGAGEQRAISFTAAEAEPQSAASAAMAPEPSEPEPAEADAPPASSAGPSWRALASAGEYARAYRRLSRGGAPGVRNDAGDLLLAADVARLGGHPGEAVGYLRRVVDGHRGDSRAPLAAFTLGRVLLDQLGRPGEAAQAFQTAQRLAPGGAMAEDALAREVVSWARAGSRDLARERARLYLRRYPKGRRSDSIRRYAGDP